MATIENTLLDESAEAGHSASLNHVKILKRAFFSKEETDNFLNLITSVLTTSSNDGDNDLYDYEASAACYPIHRNLHARIKTAYVYQKKLEASLAKLPEDVPFLTAEKKRQSALLMTQALYTQKTEDFVSHPLVHLSFNEFCTVITECSNYPLAQIPDDYTFNIILALRLSAEIADNLFLFEDLAEQALHQTDSFLTKEGFEGTSDLINTALQSEFGSSFIAKNVKYIPDMAYPLLVGFALTKGIDLQKAILASSERNRRSQYKKDASADFSSSLLMDIFKLSMTDEDMNIEQMLSDFFSSEGLTYYIDKGPANFNVNSIRSVDYNSALAKIISPVILPLASTVYERNKAIIHSLAKKAYSKGTSIYNSFFDMSEQFKSKINQMMDYVEDATKNSLQKNTEVLKSEDPLALIEEASPEANPRNKNEDTSVFKNKASSKYAKTVR